jgi:hypothetical protein
MLPYKRSDAILSLSQVQNLFGDEKGYHSNSQTEAEHHRFGTTLMNVLKGMALKKWSFFNNNSQTILKRITVFRV